ncbi:MAG: hypothetical protein ABI230_05275 [Aestuariivirga sp.]
MALQNRVDPWGELHAVPEHGTMMGNRGGKLHRDDNTLGKRRWASRQWICCEVQFRGRRHEPMGQGYTSLFFLDEVTALSAGHRPCFECRRKDAKAFLGDERVAGFDRRLHEERLHPSYQGPLCEGVMVEIGGQAYAVRQQKFLRWSFGGYEEAINPRTIDKVLTPPSIIAILAKGYTPRWHKSALQWDGT